MGDDDKSALERHAIQERLKALIAQRTQADVARKTHTLPNKVNRYVHGAKVPAEFCAALVRAYNINPAWLLLGEGVADVDDIAANVGETANNILDLVAALNSVARMRLGALTGKQHLKALRELNDALDTYEHLWEKLNGHTSGVLEEVLDSTSYAILNQNGDSAKHLLDVARQVTRICDDKTLQLRLDQTTIAYKHNFESPTAKGLVEMQRKLFYQYMADGPNPSPEAIEEAANLVVTLYSSGHLKEALRIGRATIELARDQNELNDNVYKIHLLVASIDVNLGHLNRGMRRMARYWPKVDDRERQVAYPAMLRNLVYTSQLAFVDLAVTSTSDDFAASERMRLSWLSNDIDVVRKVYRTCRRPFGDKGKRNVSWAVSALRVSECLATESESEFEEALDNFDTSHQESAGHSAYDEFTHNVLRSMLFRYHGNSRQCGHYFKQAQRHLDALDSEVTPRIDTRMLHALNGIGAFKKSRSKDLKLIVDESEQILDALAKGGFVFLKNLA